MPPSAIGGVGPGSPLASAASATNTISRAHLISPFFARRRHTLHRDDRTRVRGQAVAKLRYGASGNSEVGAVLGDEGQRPRAALRSLLTLGGGRERGVPSSLGSSRAYPDLLGRRRSPLRTRS